MKDVFISFSSKETAEAIQVCELLEQNHISCFISTRDLVSGREYAEQLVQNIDEVKAVVLLLSNNSNNSPYVPREIEYAVSHKVPILVHALEEVSLSKSMEYYLMTHQWITNTADRDQKFRHRDGLVDVVVESRAVEFVPLESASRDGEQNQGGKCRNQAHGFAYFIHRGRRVHIFLFCGKEYVPKC